MFIEVSPFPVDPRFAVDQQFDLIVEGTSIDRFARDGDCIRCVRLEARDAQDGDLVVVEREEHGKIETTVKRLRSRNGAGAELMPYSTDPAWQEPVTYNGKDATTRILGTVLYAYRRPPR